MAFFCIAMRTYWRDIRMISVCFSAALYRPVKVTVITNLSQVEPGKTFSVRAGIGSYNGYQALSIGASGRIFDGLVVKAAVGLSENGHAAFGGGVSYSW